MKHILLALYLISVSTIGFSQIRPKEEVLKSFVAQTGASASVNNTTSSPNFLRFPSDRSFISKGQNTEDKSHYFLAENPALYGIRPGLDLFKTKTSEVDSYGLNHVTLQQTYQGVPVYDGILRFHYTKDGTISSINGNFIPNIKLSATPQLSPKEAQDLAVSKVEDPLGGSPAVKALPATLYLYQQGLVYGQLGAVHLVYEVEVRNDADIRQFVYVDAHTGEIVDQIAGMAQLTRVLSETTQANVIWTEGSVFPGLLDQWQQSELESAGHIYYMMKHAFGWTSYDNNDAVMRTINNNPQIRCPNASWNGVTANYCTGTASDDVVAHEWGHAYTQYTSGLIYAWQSGALNEAYSDIWGETVDMLNNYMDSGENNALRTGCGSSDRWKLGEKATAFNGNLRDMWSPTCNGDPGKVSDPEYHCIPSDQGGVHYNSGVVNHAYALLVDGGTYNGYTINGIGLTKAAHIFWRVQRVYLTPTSDFTAQANALEAAAADLIGQNLKALSTSSTDPGLSGQVITAADVAEVVKVTKAVELRLNPLACGHTSYYQPLPTNCDGATSGKAYFYEDFESGFDGWTLSTVSTATNFTARNWEVKNTSLLGRSGHSAFAIDPELGDCANFNEQGVLRMESPVITIPATAGAGLSLAFQHYISLETLYDGGNVKYKIGSGAWTLVPASAFLANPYIATLYTTAQGSNNPLGGQPGFTAGNVSSLASGWIESRVNLGALGLVPGQTIQFRWELGTDCGYGWEGWYVDNISVYSCALPAVHFAVASSQANEGQATTTSGCLNYVDIPVAVTIDKAPSQPATVTFNTPTGTATQGATADYTISPASVTLGAGNTTANVIVRIYNDGSLEGNETVNLSFTVNANGGDAYVGAEINTHTLTIVDNERDPANFNGEIYSADFNTSTQGWSIINGGSNASTWQRVPYYSQTSNNVTNYFSLGKTPFMFVNSNAAGAATMDEIIESPAFNTLGFSDLKVRFTEGFYIRLGNGSVEQGIIEVWDGSAWRGILTETETTGNSGQLGNPVIRTVNIPAAYANAAMKIRFRYQAQNDYWWAIDDVKISGTPQIQTAVSTAAPQYLGPLATIYFNDPVTGKLVAKIKNLTNHDYGCTSVTIDRAGTDATPWLENYKITNKTVKVTPTNNISNGNYEITLYYSAAELPTFNGTAVKSMGKSSGFIGTGNAGDNSFAEVVQTTAFYSDYAFTATFNSGFSGFGLSDAPPVGALPVELVAFEGKSTNEGNLLKWNTASEAQNDYFVLERSTKTMAFEAIGKIKGAGTTALPTSYQFVDTKAAPGISYYRLTQVDFNKKSTQSRIISIDSRQLRELKLYPNPVQSLLTVELPDAKAETVQVQIFSSNGQQVIQQKNVRISEGRLKTDVSKLTPGNYQVIVTDDHAAYQLSIIKQ